MDARTVPVTESVRSCSPLTDRAQAAQSLVLEFLVSTTSPFSRSDDVRHITASAAVVSHRGFLLHKHKLSGLWMQPGGHVDGAEMPHDAAVREVLEETGLRVSHPAGGPRLIGMDVHETSNGHVHYDLQYLLESDGDDPAPPPGESQEVVWAPFEEALASTDEACQALITAARSLR